jgi:Ca2+/Na+ antiporter
VEFDSGQLSATIPVLVKSIGRFESSEEFQLIIDQGYGGVRFDKTSDGGETSCILTIIIKADETAKPRIKNMASSLRKRMDKMELGHQKWKEQFQDAIFLEADEENSPSYFDYVMHTIAMPWKLIFAFVPPVDYCNGWLCFYCSLLMIGALTAVVCDMANLVGCTLNIPVEITAITFVALGTSLPDTFASKTAALMDPYADACIGNITGSNSVNVFLGLGLPWTLASVYWRVVDLTDWRTHFLPADPSIGRKEGKYYDVRDLLKDFPDGAFVVPAKSLWFHLIVFTVNASIALTILAIRRKIFGGELGGPFRYKLITSCCLVLQWFLYVALSAWWSSSFEDD